MQPILHSTVSFWSGGINLNLQGNLQSATKHGNPANFISSYKSASDPKTSLVLGEIENDALVFYYKNCFDLLWEKIVFAIEKNLWNSRLKAMNLQKFWDQ